MPEINEAEARLAAEFLEKLYAKITGKAVKVLSPEMGKLEPGLARLFRGELVGDAAEARKGQLFTNSLPDAIKYMETQGGPGAARVSALDLPEEQVFKGSRISREASGRAPLDNEILGDTNMGLGKGHRELASTEKRLDSTHFVPSANANKKRQILPAGLIAGGGAMAGQGNKDDNISVEEIARHVQAGGKVYDEQGNPVNVVDLVKGMIPTAQAQTPSYTDIRGQFPHALAETIRNFPAEAGGNIKKFLGSVMDVHATGPDGKPAVTGMDTPETNFVSGALPGKGNYESFGKSFMEGPIPSGVKGFVDAIRSRMRGAPQAAEVVGAKQIGNSGQKMLGEGRTLTGPGDVSQSRVSAQRPGLLDFSNTKMSWPEGGEPTFYDSPGKRPTYPSEGETIDTRSGGDRRGAYTQRGDETQYVAPDQLESMRSNGVKADLERRRGGVERRQDFAMGGVVDRGNGISEVSPPGVKFLGKQELPNGTTMDLYNLDIPGGGATTFALKPGEDMTQKVMAVKAKFGM